MIVDDLLAMDWDERSAAIEMLSDLKLHGLQSRFAKKMHGPLWELKTRARGGTKGGVRVYLIADGDDLLLVRAEAKSDEAADNNIIKECIQVWKHRKGLL